MRKAMIVWGGWAGHDPDLCASMMRGWLKAEGFDVRVETTTAAFADPAIHDLSLIVPIFTMSKIEKAEALNLCAAVRAGVGLAGHHGGMCDAFRDSVDYQFLCGGQWVAHPGNIIDYKVDIVPTNDPIVAGIESFEHRSEQYYMHVDPANEVLATTTFSGEHAPWIDGVVMPVIWKKRYGEGRVFYSSLGHRAYELDVPEIRTVMIRGMLWGGAAVTSYAGSKATLEDVARMAGVSLATVDRVVNRRVGVRERTIARVEAAVAKLGYRADTAATRLARNRSFRFAFILPTGANTFMTNLAEQVRRTADWLAGHRGFIDVLHVDVFDPDALAGALVALSPDYHGVAIIALDHPRVRGAIDDLAARGVAVVTLVSDAPGARRLHYVGIDNPAAGRTAATLMGRFLRGRKGAVGVIAGSLALRDHAERQFGFNQILSGEYPDLGALPALEGRDDSTRTQTLTATLLAQRPDLVGIYSVGAGNRGIAAALEASGRSREVVWIAHELTVHTRDFLLRGVVDAVINQDPGHEARSAARVLLAHCWGDPILADQERINIDIFLRDNLP